LGIEIVKKLRTNPNSRVGFQSTLIQQLDKQSADYCLEKLQELKTTHKINGVKIKLDTIQGRFLFITKDLFLKHEQVFKDYQVKKIRSNYQLVDPHMQILNQRVD
jgi:hypothetical protein